MDKSYDPRAVGLPKIIAIDFDNTLFITDFPKIIRPCRNIIQMALDEQAEGAKLILWTCRCGQMLTDAIEACEKVGLRFDAVNMNLPEVSLAFGSDSRKVFADEYWDDLSWNPPNILKCRKSIMVPNHHSNEL